MVKTIEVPPMLRVMVEAAEAGVFVEAEVVAGGAQAVTVEVLVVYTVTTLAKTAGRVARLTPAARMEDLIVR